ncbi:acyl-CoA Delta-9 desaturase [Plodia interpunctella]|uniref:acyl-CoA Delta-9 desaturase n=1 Tax=Plodia interpunctella TaxID=58824 RepID=UPI0023677B8F|nr:acyl-CoA Delta-9 desaturase [Plodia interpunctella]XP_053613161.1 acyl-CoA Delta-9 desaturase [Plodia interpunctella]
MEENSNTNGDGKLDVRQLSKKREADWPAVLFFIHIHLLSLYGLWLLLYEVQWLTVLFLMFLTSIAVLGVTTGAHRLWAHRAYRASTGLRITLMLFQTMTGQGSVYEWVRHHRLHHQLFSTDNDPYDYNKGFLYSHILTRLWKLSPQQEMLRESIDMSDLEKDGVVMFQKKMYWLLYLVLFLLLPLNAPLEYWNDTILSAVFVIGFLRYGIVLHASWLVESGISVWGLKPGQKSPPDSNSVFILSKTFWPHYHYLVPYDYKSGEYGTYDTGCSTAFIRVWAALGLATNLRTVDTPTLQKALAITAKTQLPLQTCLDQLADKTNREDHYLKRG